MIPILGETVLSIIHGPATTSHIFELSQFLRRPINVWAKDRLLLFGRCHHRHKPRLHLKYVSPLRLARRGGECTRCGGSLSSSTSSAAGHFTLLEGHEPRNPDARSHPENCGFDVVSDQTGYPATVLRQVVAQRLLVKLYESRLRGRDHHFQCSRCSLSGGRLWSDIDSEKLIEDSKDYYSGHAHMHVYRESCDRQCACSATGSLKVDGGLKSINCMDKYLLIKNDGEKTTKTLFECDRDLIECLTKVMNGEPAKAARKCMEQLHIPSCEEYRFDVQRASIRTYIHIDGLERRAYSFTWDKERNRLTDFYFKFKNVRTILKSRVAGITDIHSKRDVFRVLYLESMWPLMDWAGARLSIPQEMVKFKPALREQQQTSNSSSTPNKQKIASDASFLSPTSNQLPSRKPPLPPRTNQQTPCKQKIASAASFLSPTSNQLPSGKPPLPPRKNQQTPCKQKIASAASFLSPTSNQLPSRKQPLPPRKKQQTPSKQKIASDASLLTPYSIWGSGTSTSSQPESGGPSKTVDKMSPKTLRSASKPSSSQGSSAAEESTDANEWRALPQVVRQHLRINNNRQNNILDDSEPTQRKQPKRTTE